MMRKFFKYHIVLDLQYIFRIIWISGVSLQNGTFRHQKTHQDRYQEGEAWWNSEVSGKYSLRTGILPLMQLSGNDFKTIFRNFGRLSLVLIWTVHHSSSSQPGSWPKSHWQTDYLFVEIHFQILNCRFWMSFLSMDFKNLWSMMSRKFEEELESQNKS